MTTRWKFSQIKPAKARGHYDPRLLDNSHYVAEIKYDGFREIGQFCGGPKGSCVVRFTSTRESARGGGLVEKTDSIPHLSGAWPRAHWNLLTDPGVKHVRPPASMTGTVLDGELICIRPGIGHEGRSKFVGSVMGSLPERAIGKQMTEGWLRWVVFDCLVWHGFDIREKDLLYRRSAARFAVQEWANPWVDLAVQASPGENKRAFLREVLARHEEGIILKEITSTYGDEQAWVKYKQDWTADCVIIGYKSAREMSKKVDGEISMTKFAKAGLIGAVVVGQHRHHGLTVADLIEVATISGMDDDLRAKLTRHGKKYLGRVVRIKHNGREPTGRFRHPRWDSFRDDKAAQDCVYREEET